MRLGFFLFPWLRWSPVTDAQLAVWKKQKKQTLTNKKQRSRFQLNPTVRSLCMCMGLCVCHPVFLHRSRVWKPISLSSVTSIDLRPSVFFLSVKLNLKEGQRRMPWPLVIGKTSYALRFASEYTVFGSCADPYISLTSTWLCVALPWSGFDGWWLFPFAWSLVSVCWSGEVTWATGFLFVCHVFTATWNGLNQQSPSVHAISCF